jgi:preprotein translocase subunit SecA
MSLGIPFIEKLFPDESKKTVKSLTPLVDRVFSFEEELKSLSDSELKERSLLLKKEVTEKLEGKSGDELKHEEKKVLEEVLPIAFALVRESARRTLHMMHYRVQVIGGILLHRGHISEMRTGEGKTLVATLPAYLNALTGKGVHVITVNDYLARRDGVWMGQVYALLGLSLGVINQTGSYLYDAMHVERDATRDAVVWNLASAS